MTGLALSNLPQPQTDLKLGPSHSMMIPTKQSILKNPKPLRKHLDSVKKKLQLDTSKAVAKSNEGGNDVESLEMRPEAENVPEKPAPASGQVTYQGSGEVNTLETQMNTQRSQGLKVILSHQTPKSNMSQQESPIIKNQFVGILQTNEP